MNLLSGYWAFALSFTSLYVPGPGVMIGGWSKHRCHARWALTFELGLLSHRVGCPLGHLFLAVVARTWEGMIVRLVVCLGLTDNLVPCWSTSAKRGQAKHRVVESRKPEEFPTFNLKLASMS